MRLFIIALGLTCCTLAAAAQSNYEVTSISKDLLPYASDIVRNEEVTVEVKDVDNVLYHVKKTVTVLNKNGDNYAHIAIYYDKSESIKNVKGLVYNQFGVQIDKFSENKFDDVAVGDGFSLFEDSRVKHYLPSVTEYPYTISYEYEKRLKQSLNIPEWMPNGEEGVAVEKSSYTFICKPDFKIRYKEINLPSKVTADADKNGNTTYTWSVSNLKAHRYEPFSPDYRDLMSCVKIAPDKFSYYGLKGDYHNWNDLGKWINDKLVSNRQELPYTTISYVKELTRDIADPKLKAKKIYEYMQQKTHYISVRVGVGGYQPFLAADVDKQNFGDCKALVNYTQALLKAVNIDSYYCIVEAGRSHNVSLMSDFASMDQANHIILCLPFKNDTTWVDCTSQTIPFGYLGDFTDNRTVLALTPEGGKLMRTPKYTPAKTLEKRKGVFQINDDGELSGSMSTVFKGADYDDRDNIIEESKTDQLKKIKKLYPINNIEIEQLDLKQDKSFDPTTTETIKLQARDYASNTDGKLYFMVNPANRLSEPPKQIRNRVNKVYITRGYTEEDEMVYTIPKGYHLSKLPLNVELDKPFANFKAKIELKDNQLIYKRKLQVLDGSYEKEAYQDLVDFFQSVVDADDYDAILAKN